MTEGRKLLFDNNMIDDKWTVDKPKKIEDRILICLLSSHFLKVAFKVEGTNKYYNYLNKQNMKARDTKTFADLKKDNPIIYSQFYIGDYSAELNMISTIPNKSILHDIAPFYYNEDGSRSENIVEEIENGKEDN